LNDIAVFSATKAVGVCRIDNGPVAVGDLINYFRGSILCLLHAQELAAANSVNVVNTTGQKPARQAAVSTPVQSVPVPVALAPAALPEVRTANQAAPWQVSGQLVTAAAVREVLTILNTRLDVQASQIELLWAKLAETRGLDAQFGGAIVALVRNAPAPVRNPDGNTVVAEVPVTVPPSNTQCPTPTKLGAACKGNVGQSGFCGPHTPKAADLPTPQGELAPVTDGAALLPLG
jgi:hypothetical protein